MRNKFRGFNLSKAVKSGYGKVAAGVSTALASGMAFAAATPGSLIAGELSGGSTEMGLVIAGVAVLLGLLILWGYLKRTR